jgi:hypothetical protein
MWFNKEIFSKKAIFLYIFFFELLTAARLPKIKTALHGPEASFDRAEQRQSLG